MKRTSVDRAEFDAACNALWSEICYQDSLPRRTDDEAKDVPGFLTLLNAYVQKTTYAWADCPGTEQPDGTVQVEEALNGLRKICAIALRAMIYNGIRQRKLT